MRRHPLLLSGLLSLLVALPAESQTKPFSAGDGRIHGGPVLPVVDMPLLTGQVTAINLRPGFHTALQFPAPVVRIDAGDGQLFTAEIVGSTVFLKAIEVDPIETSMTVLLGDARQSLVPFLVRADETQAAAYVINFSETLASHLNSVESQISERLNQDVDGRVEELAESAMRQRLLYKNGTIRVGREIEVGPKSRRLIFRIEDLEQMPGPDGSVRLYVRYTIVNRSPYAFDDVAIGVRVDQRSRRLLFFHKDTWADLHAEDVRTSPVVPPGSSVRGILILDGVILTSNQSLSFTLSAGGGQIQGLIRRAVVGN